jgi:predicted DNA-binding antitoxin AbrB/MazE fold protein
MVTQHAEAIFEDGLLRPLDPLSLQDKQHVLLTITEVSAPSANSGQMPEQEWLRAHGREYSGQWVALDGEELLSHGSDARRARDEARAKGIRTPLMVHIPDEPDPPSAFWV